MRNLIYIGKPYIDRKDEYVRLCAEVKKPSGKITTFWFEVPTQYEEYLCIERSNAFILALYEYAMLTDCDIKCDVPMDEALQYQLTNYGSNIIAKNLPYMHEINIDVPFTSQRLKSQGAVGTGFSGGVDSFYSVLKHLELNDSSYQLTHLLIVNNGAFTGEENTISEKFFFEQIERFAPAVYALGLPLIGVNTNSGDFNSDLQIEKRAHSYGFYNTAIRLASAVYALQKLFSVYYLASSFPVNVFAFDDIPDYTLLYYLKLFTTPSLTFYGSGFEIDRIGKVNFICRNPIVQKYLSLELGINHAQSLKSIRTMFELYALNMLDAFDAVLDVDDFKKNLSSRLGWYLSQKIDKREGFLEETLSTCKKNGIKIPKTAYLKCWLYYMPLNFIKTIFKNNKMIKKIYTVGKIDILLYGSRERRGINDYR